MEVRTVVSKIITEFDIQLAAGEDGAKLLKDTKDIFTLELADLFLCFTTRVTKTQYGLHSVTDR